MLSSPSLNPIQHWALQYHLFMVRRQEIEDAEAALEAHCSVMLPDRWREVYGNQSQDGDIGQAFDGEEELPVTDPSDLNRLSQWAESLDQQRGMTWGEVQHQLSGNRILGYAEGASRKV